MPSSGGTGLCEVTVFRVAVVMGLLILLASPTLDWNMQKSAPVAPIVVNDCEGSGCDTEDEVEQPSINPARPVNQQV